MCLCATHIAKLLNASLFKIENPAHSTTKHAIGPSLVGLVGQKASRYRHFISTSSLQRTTETHSCCNFDHVRLCPRKLKEPFSNEVYSGGCFGVWCANPPAKVSPPSSTTDVFAVKATLPSLGREPALRYQQSTCALPNEPCCVFWRNRGAHFFS